MFPNLILTVLIGSLAQRYWRTLSRRGVLSSSIRLVIFAAFSLHQRHIPHRIGLGRLERLTESTGLPSTCFIRSRL
ncbi:hypothetical protein DFS33DRAFT_1355549 [Desarmillaria ectypa]|nr:hypothetical protein DFS33DRAFT_1355549 [Desarmillaria ectypa]